MGSLDPRCRSLVPRSDGAPAAVAPGWCFGFNRGPETWFKPPRLRIGPQFSRGARFIYRQSSSETTYKYGQDHGSIFFHHGIPFLISGRCVIFCPSDVRLPRPMSACRPSGDPDLLPIERPARPDRPADVASSRPRSVAARTLCGKRGDTGSMRSQRPSGSNRAGSVQRLNVPRTSDQDYR